MRMEAGPWILTVHHTWICGPVLVKVNTFKLVTQKRRIGEDSDDDLLAQLDAIVASNTAEL